MATQEELENPGVLKGAELWAPFAFGTYPPASLRSLIRMNVGAYVHRDPFR